MEPVLTPEAMAGADRRTIEAGTPVELLMERAGLAVAWSVRDALCGCYGRRVVVICGKGNNGGDGRVAARALRRWGARVAVLELANLDRQSLARALSSADAAVDAMFGTGLQRELDGDAAWIVQCLHAWRGLTVAVDIPSGIDGLTGAVRGAAVTADRTVTFAARKPGLVLEPGRSHAGAVRVVDIDIDLGPDGNEPLALGMLHAADVAGLLPPRAPDAHKWVNAVMVVGGSGGMTGAPLFASHAAMRAGAGMVWCALPGDDTARRAGGTEVVTRALPDHNGLLAPEAAGAVLENVGRFGALALGPGLGADESIRAAVRALVEQVGIPLVLDADGLNALAGDTAPLEARRSKGLATVLTPHGGEYARLVGHPVGDDRVAAARHLAGRSGAVVLLKGPGTVVADPGGRAAINPTGSAALASAGTGDVLTGIVAAFVARGVPAFEAAAAAAWVHGAAADHAELTTGPTGLAANDLLAAIAPTLLALHNNHRSERERPQ